MAKKLTAKQEKFVTEYLVDLNATQAAIRAGYKQRAAYATGHENLKKPEIIKALEKERKRLSKLPNIASPEEVLEGYTRDTRFDPRKLYDADGNLKPVVELDDDTALALSGLEIEDHVLSSGENEVVLKRKYKYKLPDKKGNRDSLGKHYGMFIDKKEHSLSSDTMETIEDIMKSILSEVDGKTKSEK